MTPACVIQIGGYSGSGKTALIRRALRELKGEGLYVGVLKHAHHRLELDREGKDTDMFYREGADFVFAHDAQQGFARYPFAGAGLRDALERIPRGLDLVLVEGHKHSDMPGIWLEKKMGVKTPHTKAGRILYRDDPRYLEKLLLFIHEELSRSQAERPLRAGLLVGGKSLRMGRSKALLKVRGETLVERSLNTLSGAAGRVVLLGPAELPRSLKNAARLPDVPGAAGPMAGMLSAFRWDPDCAWIISAVDLPLMHKKAWKWLLDQRRPGVWAVLPRLKDSRKVETTGACYEPMIFGYIGLLAGKGLSRLQEIAGHPKVITPLIPDSLASAWKNVNTEEDWKQALALAGKKTS